MTTDEQRPTTVVLRHALPDGTSHFDWLLLPDGAMVAGPDDRVLVTFRSWQRPDELAAGQTLAVERVPAHRALYLSFEGEIEGGRGQVARVAIGWLSRCRVGADEGLVHARWLAPGGSVPTVAYHLRARTADRWTVTAEALPIP